MRKNKIFYLFILVFLTTANTNADSSDMCKNFDNELQQKLRGRYNEIINGHDPIDERVDKSAKRVSQGMRLQSLLSVTLDKEEYCSDQIQVNVNLEKNLAELIYESDISAILDCKGLKLKGSQSYSDKLLSSKFYGELYIGENPTRKINEKPEPVLYGVLKVFEITSEGIKLVGITQSEGELINANGLNKLKLIRDAALKFKKINCD